MPLRLLFRSNSLVMQDGFFVNFYQFIANSMLTVLFDTTIANVVSVVETHWYLLTHLRQCAGNVLSAPCLRHKAVLG